MSDEAKTEEKVAEGAAAPKKKKGKLPIIAVLLLVVLGGGFFVMKGKSAKPAAPTAPVLGAIEPVKEMLVNLNGGQYYLKTEISLHMVKDYKKEDLEKNKEAVSDAILLVLKAKSLSDLQTPDQLRALKKEIAAAVNAILNREKNEADKAKGEADKSSDDEKPSKDAKKDDSKDSKSKDSKDSKKDAKDDSSDSEDKPAKVETPPDFDSATGPVLKVYFTSFATQ